MYTDAALRGTAASAVSRIVRFHAALGAQMVDKVGLAALVQAMLTSTKVLAVLEQKCKC